MTKEKGRKKEAGATTILSHHFGWPSLPCPDAPGFFLLHAAVEMGSFLFFWPQPTSVCVLYHFAQQLALDSFFVPISLPRPVTRKSLCVDEPSRLYLCVCGKSYSATCYRWMFTRLFYFLSFQLTTDGYGGNRWS